MEFSGMTGRNQDAVRKTTAGLLKLVFPHRTMESITEEELDSCLVMAAECRERVVAQLALLAPGEFKSVRFSLPRRAMAQ
jgi:predicted ATP-dependent Lon-type protease